METIERFRQVFVSSKNSDHLFGIILDNYDINDNQTYYTLLINIQNAVFNSIFPSIYDNISKTGQFDLEKTLIELNKYTLQAFDNNFEATQPRQLTYEHGTEIDEVSNKATQTNNLDEVSNKATQTDNLDEALNEKTYHIFSEDMTLDPDGKYTFTLPCNQIIKNLNIKNMSITCSWFNITEKNNTFVVEEHHVERSVSISIGYYTIERLVDTLRKSLNVSQERIYSIQIDACTGKTIISCANEKQIPLSFSLHFPELDNYIGINTMLGYENDEYEENSFYIADSLPLYDVYNTIFLKLKLDEQEVSKYETSNNSHYFEKICINYSLNFGKTLMYSCGKDPFILEKTKSVKQISVVLSSKFQPLKSFMFFDFELHINSQ